MKDRFISLKVNDSLIHICEAYSTKYIAAFDMKDGMLYCDICKKGIPGFLVNYERGNRGYRIKSKLPALVLEQYVKEV